MLDTAPFRTFDQPWPAREGVRITGMRAIVTAPEGTPLVVVRVDTDVDGLYGLGCATFTQRWHAVVAFVEKHLAPLVVGRYPGDIGDLCNYDNPKLNSLTNQIEALPPNSPKLKSLWTQAQQLIIRNALSIYIDYSPVVFGAAKLVKNLQIVPYVGGVVNYWTISVPA